MANYDNTNSGIITRNERRTTDKHPEYTGSLNVEGVEYWVSAWVNEGRAGGKLEGKKYFSIKLTRKDSRGGGNGGGGGSRPKPDVYDFSDDIPF